MKIMVSKFIGQYASFRMIVIIELSNVEEEGLLL